MHPSFNFFDSQNKTTDQKALQQLTRHHTVSTFRKIKVKINQHWSSNKQDHYIPNRTFYLLLFYFTYRNLQNYRAVDFYFYFLSICSGGICTASVKTFLVFCYSPAILNSWWKHFYQHLFVKSVGNWSPPLSNTFTSKQTKDHYTLHEITWFFRVLQSLRTISHKRPSTFTLRIKFSQRVTYNGGSIMEGGDPKSNYSKQIEINNDRMVSHIHLLIEAC